MADSVNPFTPQMQGQFNDLMALQTNRAARQEPVHQAALAMAMHMAPTYARAGVGGGTQLGSTAGAGGGGGASPTPSLDTGGGNEAAKKMALLAIVSALVKGASGAAGQNGGILSLLKHLFSGGGDPTYGGLIQGNKPLPGGTGFPSVPGGGGGGAGGGGMSAIPGYFQNPNGSLVQIPGDPSNGGGYGGGLFPVTGDGRQE